MDTRSFYADLPVLDDFQAIARPGSQLAYGLHVAPTALMTCLVFERSSGQHVHFVDGSDGGYAMAAIDLKARLHGREG